MPTYKNIGNHGVEVINSVSFIPLQEVEVNFYVDPKQYPHIKLISEEPIYSPVAYSELISAGSINLFEHRFSDVNMLRLVSKSPYSSVSFNSKDSPQILISSAEPLVLRGIDRYKEIFVISGEVSVELWREFNWRG